MREMDIIILSNAYKPSLYDTTFNAVQSLINSEKEIRFNAVIIEQQLSEKYSFPNCRTIHRDGNFNYNRFMNYGLQYCTSDYVALCNNDLLFQPGWATEILKAMEENNLLSASPLCPVSHKREKNLQAVNYGYEIYYRLCGWCIVLNRKIFDTIGKLDDSFGFWYADNLYAEQLKKYNIQHAMIRDSKVIHLGSKTLRTLPPLEQRKLTSDETVRYKLNRG
jgi:GT2 family glycosyltransferase